jgi:hypothetical protein
MLNGIYRGNIIYFLICKVCFWCASLINNRSFYGCPCCGSTKIRSLPVRSPTDISESGNLAQGWNIEMADGIGERDDEIRKQNVF